MTIDECKRRIADKLDQCRSDEFTGRVVIELVANNGGISHTSFYRSLNMSGFNRRTAVFSGGSGPVIMEKYL